MKVALGVQSHYSTFPRAYGSPMDVVEVCDKLGYKAVGIADSMNCVSHREFAAYCNNPLFGARLKLGQEWLTAYAFDIEPFYKVVTDVINGKPIDSNHYCVWIRNGDSPKIHKGAYFELSLATSIFGAKKALHMGAFPVAMECAKYPLPEHRAQFELLKGRQEIYPQHILGPEVLLERLAARFGQELVDSACTYTEGIARHCEGIKLPKSNMKIEGKGFNALAKACWQSLGNCEDITYIERLKHELEVIKAKEFDWYFHLVADLINHVCSVKGELVGPGRGSCCGSLVCYLLGITAIDPIKHGLLFERFIDVSRNDLPDIDIDFTPNGREIAYRFVQQNYGGPDRIARLITIARYQTLSILQDIKRNLGREISVPRQAFHIQDTPRHFGKHPAAIAISSIPLSQIAPKNEQGALMLESGLNRQTAEIDAGLIKIDALGLSQVGIFKEFLRLTGKSIEQFYQIENEYVQAFNTRRYSGVFQFGYAVKAIAEEMEFSTFQDIADVVALARPGPKDAGYVDIWLDARKTGRAQRSSIESIERILAPTKGVFIYQEQVMQICRETAGFDWPEVNGIRRGIGKKNVAKIQEYKQRFIKQCDERNPGYDANFWADLWEAIEGCGNYAFNKSHAVAYALTAYACMRMKCEYPQEYLAAYLKHESDNDLKLAAIKEIFSYRTGIEFLRFHPDKSHPTDWIFSDNTLIAPLTNLVGVGEKTALAANAKRDETGMLPDKFRRESHYRIDSIEPIRQSILQRYGSLENAGIATFPVSVREFIKQKSDNDRVLLGKVDMANVKPYKYDARGKTANYLSFRITDDTGSIFCRYHPYGNEKLQTAIDAIQDNAIVAAKGNIYQRESFSMMIVDRFKVL